MRLQILNSAKIHTRTYTPLRCGPFVSTRPQIPLGWWLVERNTWLIKSVLFLFDKNVAPIAVGPFGTHAIFEIPSRVIKILNALCSYLNSREVAWREKRILTACRLLMRKQSLCDGKQKWQVCVRERRCAVLQLFFYFCIPLCIIYNTADDNSSDTSNSVSVCFVSY